MDEHRLRCARCGQAFSEAENADAGARSARPNDVATLERIHDSFSRDPALESHLVKMLGHLDAGRAVDAVHGVAHRADLLQESLSLATSPDEPPRKVAELLAACQDYVRDYGAGSQPIGALPHIGWQEVIEDLPAASERYGFSSTGSIEIFEELLRYLSGACHRMAPAHSASLEVVAGISETSASLQQHCEEIRALISREADECRRIRRVFDHTCGIVRDVLARTEDFARRRRLLQERGQSEPERAVADLLKAIGNVLSPWAWLGRSPESRVSDCQPVGGYRLRLSFADGLVREIELGEDYWSTTGLSIDPELFRSVHLDVERNVLVWTNGIEIPGERLHLAIKEGRLGNVSRQTSEDM